MGLILCSSLRVCVTDRHPDKVLCVLWLGSSVGNLTPADTLAFFQDMLRIGGPLTEVRHFLTSTKVLPLSRLECNHRALHTLRMSAVWSSRGSLYLLQLTVSVALLAGQSGDSGWTVQVLVCTDLWKDQKVLHAAYCDSLGVTEAFIKNGDGQRGGCSLQRRDQNGRGQVGI